MKILYVNDWSVGSEFSASNTGNSYMCDMIFHGARSLFGTDCIDSTRAWYMYDDSYVDTARHKLYGLGFNYAAKLPVVKIDRSSLREKILDRYFDLIIYGMGRQRLKPYWDDVIKVYKREQIVLIDGNDRGNILLNDSLVEKALYFKREFVTPSKWPKGVLPLSYSIPKSQVVTTPVQKLGKDQFVSPPNHGEYGFRNEEEYNKNYQKSMFALTRQKLGWDCFRHYEIVANGCIPIFYKYSSIPDSIMTTWDRSLFRDAYKLMWDTKSQNTRVLTRYYRDLAAAFTDQMLKRQTTEKAVEYILNHVNI